MVATTHRVPRADHACRLQVGCVLYNLFAVVVHVGSGPNHGHYVCLVKSPTGWLCIDDDIVEAVDETVLHTFFGSDDGSHPSPGSKATPSSINTPGSPGDGDNSPPGDATPMSTDLDIPPGSIPAPTPLAPSTPLPGGSGIAMSGSSSDAYILFYEAVVANSDEKIVDARATSPMDT